MSTTATPPHSTATEPAQSPAMSTFEQTRRENLKTEGQIRTVGTSLAVAGLVVFLPIVGAAILKLIGGFNGSSDEMGQAMAGAVSILIFALFPAIFVVLGNRLEKLDPTSRIGGILACCFAIVSAPPFGLIFGIAGLVVLLRAPSKSVLSPEYSQVIEQTPTIKSRRSWIIPLFVGIVAFIYLVMLGIAVANAAANQPPRGF